MKTVDLQQLPPTDRQQWLQAAIAPRPICFASSISSTGQVNLSPFSFFNLFSVNPAVVVFSPSRRLRDNTTKHTLDNVLEVPEVVINMVDEAMVHQTSLASCEYNRDTNEFTKAGFSMQAATIVSPPMVTEAKVKFECRVIEVKSLGENGGAGQLVIAEVLCMHVDESILSPSGTIDTLAFHLVARMGGDWYCRVDASNLFTIPKPNTQLGIGIDALPAGIKNSSILTGNHLGQLANVHEIPAINPAFQDDTLKNIFQYFSLSPDDMEKELHLYATALLNQNKVYEAWQVLLTIG